MFLLQCLDKLYYHLLLRRLSDAHFKKYLIKVLNKYTRSDNKNRTEAKDIYFPHILNRFPLTFTVKGPLANSPILKFSLKLILSYGTNCWKKFFKGFLKIVLKNKF